MRRLRALFLWEKLKFDSNGFFVYNLVSLYITMQIINFKNTIP